MTKLNELAVPPAAHAAPDATELVRAWVANKGLHCSLRPGVFGDDEVIMWGILLSDMAWHIAAALEQMQGKPKQEILATIREHFDFEIDSPTAEASGGFLQ